MHLQNLLKVLPLIAIIFLTSCEKDKNDPIPGNPSPTSGVVKVELFNIAGTQNVDETGGTTYTNALGEQFTVTMLKYYLSNFELLTDSGAHPIHNTYFLIDEEVAASKTFNLPDIPAGTYKGIRFTVGVDEDRYLAYMTNPYTGALDASNNMFWTWSTGFIHFKLEGLSPASTNGSYTYHVGGMSGMYAGQRIIEVSFGFDSLIVAGTRPAEVHLMADVLEVLNANNQLSFATTHTVMSPGPNSVAIADNYASMFRFDHLHN